MGILSDDKGDETKAAAEAVDPLAGAPAADVVVEATDEPLVSRDERADSIDPATGTLTAEAVALRREASEG